jgi:hypothetical protein
MNFKNKIKRLTLFLLITVNFGNISCKEEDNYKNEKVTEENFKKLKNGMTLKEVKLILGEKCLHDPTGKTHGLADVLPKRENKFVCIWSSNILSEIMIYGVFIDSLLVEYDISK